MFTAQRQDPLGGLMVGQGAEKQAKVGRRVLNLLHHDAEKVLRQKQHPVQDMQPQ